MARSYTEERVVKQLERMIKHHLIESNVTKEEFCEKVDVYGTTYDTLMEMADGWSPRWCYRIWDALNLPVPLVTFPEWE